MRFCEDKPSVLSFKLTWNLWVIILASCVDKTEFAKLRISRALRAFLTRPTFARLTCAS